MCALSVNGLGPQLGHCHQCDTIIDEALHPRIPTGRGQAFQFTYRELEAYDLDDAEIDAYDLPDVDDVAA